MAPTPLTYQGTGVSYDAMDPFKRAAQEAARETDSNIERLNKGEFRVFSPSRGESAFLIETPHSFLAHVEEGLGTKNLIADAMYKLTGRSYYDNVAQCTVAMIVNDIITVGGLPLSTAMHIAAGDSDWFTDQLRTGDLINGWKHACDLARCVWGGGETPTLKSMIAPDTVVLAGSAMGIVKPKSRLIDGSRIRPGDDIILIESSGIHANGLTLARTIEKSLSRGYLTELPDGRTYGETLLDPTRIYVGLIEDCFDAEVDIHYAVNITGHGWRKLMRATQPFAYIIEHLPRQLPIFDFIQEHGPVDDREAYGNLNMGAGFALYVDVRDADAVVNIATALGLVAIRAGFVDESDQKKVVIKPKGIEFLGDTLQVR